MTSAGGGSPPVCEAVLRALWEYLDRALDAVEVADIDAHLAVCDHCRGHALFEQRLLDEIRALRARRAHSDALQVRVLEILRREKLETREKRESREKPAEPGR